MLSIPDMAILGVLALLVFGEERLPKIMRQAGRVMREVQNTSQGFIREMERAADLEETRAQRREQPEARQSEVDDAPAEVTRIDALPADEAIPPELDATPPRDEPKAP